VVPPENPEAMAKAVQQAMSMGARDQEVSRRSRFAATENFSLSRVAQQHLAFYNQIVKGL